MTAKILSVHHAFLEQRAKKALCFDDGEESKDDILSNKGIDPRELLLDVHQ